MFWFLFLQSSFGFYSSSLRNRILFFNYMPYTKGGMVQQLMRHFLFFLEWWWLEKAFCLYRHTSVLLLRKSFGKNISRCVYAYLFPISTKRHWVNVEDPGYPLFSKKNIWIPFCLHMLHRLVWLIVFAIL